MKRAATPYTITLQELHGDSPRIMELGAGAIFAQEQENGSSMFDRFDVIESRCRLALVAAR